MGAKILVEARALGEALHDKVHFVAFDRSVCVALDVENPLAAYAALFQRKNADLRSPIDPVSINLLAHHCQPLFVREAHGIARSGDRPQTQGCRTAQLSPCC